MNSEMIKIVNSIKKTFALRVLTNLERRLSSDDDGWDVFHLITTIKDEVEQDAFDLTDDDINNT